MKPSRRFADWPQPFARRNHLAWLVLLLALLLTFLAWFGLRTQSSASAQQQFELHVQDTINAIEERLRQHEQILLGGAGLFAANASVARAQWHDYVERLKLKQNYPGILGVGYSEVIPPDALQAHVASVRAEGFPDYTVQPAGVRALYTSIVYLEPFAGRNLSAFGYDMFSEATRAKAMRRAGESGQATISGRVTLVQENQGKVQAGFLMYLPIYRKNQALHTDTERWAALQGFVYSPYRMDDLMLGILGKRPLDVHFAIYDGTMINDASLMYAGQDEPGNDKPFSHHPAFSTTRTVEAYGHVWTVPLHSTPQFEAQFGRGLELSILILGGSISVLLFLVVLFLISRRERAAALASTAMRLQSILDTVADGIITTDAQGRIETFNPAAEQLFGYASAEVVGQNVNLLMPEPYHSAHDGYMARFRATGKARIICQGRVVLGRRKDGSSFPLELELGQMQLGDETHFTGIVRDITERQRADAEIARNVHALADFKAALDQHALVATTDAQGTITYANDRFCLVSQYAREELIGQNHRIINSGHHPHAFFAGLWQTITSGGTWKGEIKNRAKDGSFYWVDTTIVPFLDQDLKPVQYIAIRTDITERKQAEQALIKARNTADMANNAKDAFLATMSHEIRTPLGGLMGMLELLSFSPLNAEQSETLEAARNSGRSLLRILNDILDLSKIEDGKLELAERPVGIADLVAEVINTYTHVASANSVMLSSQVDPRLSPALLVDPLRLSQVLNNFVSNAIKFSPKGQVELRAMLVGQIDDVEQVRLEVRDNGIGIAPEVQQRLFQSYSQASADTARMYGGTGLGLAICRRLADLMDGHIAVESAPGQGAIFSITLNLPVVPEGLMAAPATVVPPPPMQQLSVTDTRSVLVVDDHPLNRKLLARQLALLGVHADTAENGKLALALWRTGHYALVITDCHMPVMDGYELTRAIRADEKARTLDRMPVLAWTANALPDEIDNCQAAGMDELLVKPIEMGQLQAVLAKWLPSVMTSPSTGSGPAEARQSMAAGVAGLPRHGAPRRDDGVKSPAVDVSVLAALIGDDPATIREFLLSFAVSAKSIAAELLAACSVGDTDQVGAQAHKLKSSARSVGAMRLGELCAALEDAAKTGQAEALPALAQQFVLEMAAAEKALQDLTQ